MHDFKHTILLDSIVKVVEISATVGGDTVRTSSELGNGVGSAADAVVFSGIVVLVLDVAALSELNHGLTLGLACSGDVVGVNGSANRSESEEEGDELVLHVGWL